MQVVAHYIVKLACLIVANYLEDSLSDRSISRRSLDDCDQMMQAQYPVTLLGTKFTDKVFSSYKCES